jgi:hypothetical protein
LGRTCQRRRQVAAAHGERLLSTPNNRVSFALTLDGLSSIDSTDKLTGSLADRSQDETYLGSLLFTRGVSGTRVVRQRETASICGQRFDGFGSSTDAYPHAYLTAACAVGITKGDVDRFLATLVKSLAAFKLAREKNARKMASAVSSHVRLHSADADADAGADADADAGADAGAASGTDAESAAKSFFDENIDFGTVVRLDAVAADLKANVVLGAAFGAFDAADGKKTPSSLL